MFRLWLLETNKGIDVKSAEVANLPFLYLIG